MPFEEQVSTMRNEIQEQKENRKALRQMELFVLDNSLRESTVGQLRGHTIDNKWKIYEQVIQFGSLLQLLRYIAGSSACLKHLGSVITNMMSTYRLTSCRALTHERFTSIFRNA